MDLAKYLNKFNADLMCHSAIVDSLERYDPSAIDAGEWEEKALSRARKLKKKVRWRYFYPIPYVIPVGIRYGLVHYRLTKRSALQSVQKKKRKVSSFYFLIENFMLTKNALNLHFLEYFQSYKIFCNDD